MFPIFATDAHGKTQTPFKLNPKFEYRKTKQILNSKYPKQAYPTGLSLVVGDAQKMKRFFSYVKSCESFQN